MSVGGVPVAGVWEWAYRSEDSWVGSCTSVTNADGSYRIEGIAPSAELRIRFAPAAGSGLVPEWFDDTANRRAAMPVVVAVGASVEASAQLATQP